MLIQKIEKQESDYSGHCDSHDPHLIFIDKGTTAPASVGLATPRRGITKRRYRRVSKIPIGCGWERSGPTAFRGIEKIARESIAIHPLTAKPPVGRGPLLGYP